MVAVSNARAVVFHMVSILCFLFIGAEPNAKWLAQAGMETDAKSFVRSDPFAGNGRYPFETNIRGVFAVGDVRSGSVKRVAAAVGQGSQVVVATLHAWLARANEPLEQESAHA